MTIKLTLDEKYKNFAYKIRAVNNHYCNEIVLAFPSSIAELAIEWFGRSTRVNQIKVVERIHSADEIEWIKLRYNWRLKSDKFVSRYISSRYALIKFYDKPYGDDVMTESELKTLLEGTGLPFEAFEKVSVDD